MEYFNGILQQDFNKIYTDVENCSIIQPPYSEGRVPQTFYFTKRGGFEEYLDESYDEIFDVLNDGTSTYLIGKIGTNLVVKKGVNTLYSAPFSYDKHNKFIYGPSVSGDVVESGAMANSGSSGTPEVHYLEDTAKNWVPDEWIGKWVYIYDADEGHGQIQEIKGNTATQLVVSEGFAVPVVNGTYKVFEYFDEVIFFIGSDGFYGIHNDTNIIQAIGFGEVIDVVQAHNRFFAINTSAQLFKGRENNLSLFIDDTSYIRNVLNIDRLEVFQDYVLLLSKTEIALVKKETFKAGTEQEEEVFTYSEVTREFGVFDMLSVEVYNNGLYVFDTNKKFISISITPVSETKFTTEIKDEGIYIQKYLDNIIPGSSVSIDINPNEIKIINNHEGTTNIFIFDRYYLGWHRWTTSLNIKKYYGTLDIFYGGKGYKMNPLLKVDTGSLEITQRIRLIFGEENITSFKRVIFKKLILGTQTDTDFKINYSIVSGSDAINFTKIAKGSNLLTQQVILEGLGETALGQNLVGLGIIGGSEDTELIQNLYPSVGTIKIPFGITLELMTIDLVAEGEKKIVYGGQLVAYEVVLPHVTDVRNVI